MSCDWPVDRSCLPALPPEDDDGYELALIRRTAAEDLAVNVLWALSGRQFGICPAMVRPCAPSGVCGDRGTVVSGGVMVVAWNGEDWVNSTCGCLGGRCVESGPGMVHLPGPVHAITEVRVGDTVLDPASYALEGNVLYRRGGRWPSQNLAQPLPSPGTWSVKYERGLPVPSGGDVLAGVLAQEFISACTDGKKCRLPRNVTSLTRRGVSYQMYDPGDIFARGKTGLTEVDLWLTAVNPVALAQAPVVL